MIPSVIGPTQMNAYKTEFLELALELGVLKFGEFTLKSGRVSPYFFNAGLFNNGRPGARRRTAVKALRHGSLPVRRPHGRPRLLRGGDPGAVTGG